jgi:excisionase family DNA binding protein
VGATGSGQPYVRAAILDEVETLLTPGEVARIFRVDPKTVTRWANAGRIPSLLTPGGHRRFREVDIKRFLANRERHKIDVPDKPAPAQVGHPVIANQSAATRRPEH